MWLKLYREFRLQIAYETFYGIFHTAIFVDTVENNTRKPCVGINARVVTVGLYFISSGMGIIGCK